MFFFLACVCCGLDFQKWSIDAGKPPHKKIGISGKQGLRSIG